MKSILHKDSTVSALQAKPKNGASVAPPASGLTFIDNTSVQRKENKTGMPDQLKSGVESLSGIDMSDVKVHYNSSQPAQLNAHAYAQGNQIHIAPGQEKHLPHEAWHVVQQKQGRVRPTMQMLERSRNPALAGKSKVNINDNVVLEKEADVMGNRAVFQQRGGDSRQLEIVGSDHVPSVHTRAQRKKFEQGNPSTFQLTGTGAVVGGAFGMAAGSFFGSVGAMLGGITGAVAGHLLSGSTQLIPVFNAPQERRGDTFGLGERIDLNYTNYLLGAARLGNLIWREQGNRGIINNVIPAMGTASYHATSAGDLTLELFSQLGIRGMGAGTVIAVHRIHVIPPTDATMTNIGSRANHFDAMSWAGAGFWGMPTILPLDVSFQGLEWSEGGGVMAANGAYAVENGQAHAQGAAHNIDRDNKMVPIGQLGDDVRSMGISQAQVVPSASTWPINWQYRLQGAAGPWVVFTVATHTNNMDQDGNTRASKKGATEYRARPWPRTTWGQTFRRFNPFGGP